MLTSKQLEALYKQCKLEQQLLKSDYMRLNEYFHICDLGIRVMTIWSKAVYREFKIAKKAIDNATDSTECPECNRIVNGYCPHCRGE